MTAACFRRSAQLMHGRTNSLGEDAMNRGYGQCSRPTVATRNTGDFALFSVPVFNPFTYRP